MNFANILRWFIPNKTNKIINEFNQIVKKINELSQKYSSFSDYELKLKTDAFKNKLLNGETLDDILIEAFATVREASKRVLGLYHFDEQLLAGIALFKGMMVEMKTGEGKTLSATTATYLHALSGRPVHVATVNDYLAKRDADEMGRLYSFLGLSCDAVLENMNIYEKKQVYAKDIIYATGSTLGFDYLRDNMAMRIDEVVQRELSFVLVDEADKLIDDGRTPLIISSASEKNVDYYYYVADLIRRLNPDDYEVDLKRKSVVLTEKGIERIDEFLFQDGKLEQGVSLYHSDNLEYMHAITQCLKAFTLFKKNVDYIVHNNEVLLIDEMTGRVLEGRRLSEGLHQAIEAKERVRIHPEGEIGASISYQRFFALYEKFSGMSGTCLSEAEEFYDLYKVDTIAIPTHKKVIRIDELDAIYATFEEKFVAILDAVCEAHSRRQPVLLITNNVESSELFAKGLRSRKLKFNMLNAKFHKEESLIIAEAGMPGSITLATNMAGRGTDIQLGGNYDMRVRKLREQGMSEAEIVAKKEQILAEIAKQRKVVIEAGGLFVIGTERNESRRVDDQARGRAGRQGDPGRSRFYISCDDQLLKIYGASWIYRMLATPGEVVKDPMITAQIEKAQNTIEANNFESRKYNLKYDLVLDKQRTMIYDFRRKYLFDDNMKDQVKVFIQHNFDKLNELSDNKNYIEYFKSIFGIQFDDINEAKDLVFEKFEKLSPYLKYFKMILLRELDTLWQRHLTQVSYLREIVSLRQSAQKDPLTEFQIEAYKLFAVLLDEFRDNSLRIFFNILNEDFTELKNEEKDDSNNDSFDDFKNVFTADFDSLSDE